MAGPELMAGQVHPVDPDMSQSSAVSIAPDAIDSKLSAQLSAKAAQGGQRLATRAFASASAVTREFGRVDPDKADPFAAAPQGVAVDRG